MNTDLAAVATPPTSATPAAGDESLGFDERWDAWRAKGADHDRVVRRRMAFAVPILLLVAAVVLFAILGR